MFLEFESSGLLDLRITGGALKKSSPGDSKFKLKKLLVLLESPSHLAPFALLKCKPHPVD
jgi:hypothetical protein